MFIASLVATSYYIEWEINKLCFETVLYLGGGTCLFTISCIFFRKKYNTESNQNLEFDFSMLYSKKVKFLMIVLIMLGAIICFLKIKEYVSLYGSNLSIFELLYSKRKDDLDGDIVEVPFYIKLGDRIVSLCSYIIIWIFSLHLFSNNKDRTFFLLCVAICMVRLLSELFRGAKGGVIAFGFIVVTILFWSYLSKRKNITINMKSFLMIGLIILVFPFIFTTIQNILGRHERSSSDKSSAVAVYIGAEIKNFDILVQHNSSITNKYFGHATLKSIHRVYQTNYEKQELLGFQSVKGNSLGNVYTQFAAFYNDFGGFGVFFCTFIMAYISMLFYNKSLKTLNKPYKQNWYLYVYSSITGSLFAVFFSSGFTEKILHIGYIVDMILLIFVIKLFDMAFRLKHTYNSKTTYYKEQ